MKLRVLVPAALLVFALPWCITRDHSRYGVVGPGDFMGRVVTPVTVEGKHCGYRLFLPPIPVGGFRNMKKAMDRALTQVPEPGNALGNVEVKSRYRVYFPVIESCYIVRGTPVRVRDLTAAKLTHADAN